MQLNDKVIVITGAFGQLGRAVTQQVLADGAQAALLDVSQGVAPAGAQAWKVDLTRLADARQVLDAVAARFGRVDGIVNIAGGFKWQTVGDSDDLAEWDALHAMNLKTCITATKAALPHLERQGAGRVVNIGALAATKAASGMGAYTASKAGVARFTEALADEVKLKNITVNAILPSIIDTPQNRIDMPDAAFDRWVRPEDIARVIAFLLSDSAAAVTGALLPVTNKT